MEKNDIRRLLDPTIYARAVRYYERGRVHEYEEAESAPGTQYLTAEVSGTETYSVEIWLRESGEFVSANCTCKYNQNGDGPLCKHIGAVLLQYAENRLLLAPRPLQQLVDQKAITRGVPQREETPSAYSSNLEALFGKKWHDAAPESDPAAAGLLRSYMQEASAADLPAADIPAGLVSLELELLLDPFRREALPELRVHISAGTRSYIVKSIPELIDAVDEGRTVAYGKQLVFRHTPAAFDDLSAALLALLRRQVAALRYAGLLQGRSYSASPYTAGRGGALLLEGSIWDALYELYLPEKLLGGYSLSEGSPAFTLYAEKRRGGMSLSIQPRINWFSGEGWVYFYDNTTLWRVTRAEFASLRPALEVLGGKEVFFTKKDAAAFCSYVLPEIRGRMQLEDPERLLLDQIPLLPVTRFYLDVTPALEVTAYAEFAYGEDMVTPFAVPGEGFVRDAKTEKRAQNLLSRYLTPIQSEYAQGVYRAEGEEQLFDFLEEGVQALMAAGEVYMTDGFRAMQAPRPKITIGVSVAGSVLDLDIDTGEFPVEELQALLNSLHRKKKYHRLRDGRLLKLDSSMEALDDLEQTLELSGAGLSSAHASLPLYRAPSLDKALSGQEEICFSRDDAFRRMARSFHSVADSDFALPESLQGVLRKYQRTGYRWLRTLDSYGMGGILADDMGLGKTLQVLAYLLSVKKGGETVPALIVCPASLVLNWAEECEKFTPQLKCLAVDGTAAQRARLAEDFGQYDLVVTSYDLLRRDADQYAKQHFYACILDEAQAIKNHSTQKYKAVCRIHTRLRFALTGTPVENRLSELWSIFSFLMPGYLFPYKVFRERFEKPIVQDKNDAAARRLNQLTSPFILRRMKTEVLKELPPKTENVYHVTMGEEQRKLYLAAALEAKQELRAAKPGDRIAVFAALTRLRQICCDPRLVVEHWEGGSAKLDACIDLVSSAVDAGHQILLFSQFTSMLSLIAQRLEDADISHFTLQGATPKPVRADLVRRFNGHEVSVFLISLKAGGTGLNLTAADIVIHYDPWWNVAAQNQATDRAYRIGQENNVQVYKLIAQDTLEEKIIELQKAKQQLADTVTGAADGSIMSMKPEELLALMD